MALLSEYGFIFPRRALAKTSKESSDMALRIGFPVVMKISSPDILHKTDVGGVKLKINSRKRRRMHSSKLHQTQKTYA